jgi:hypothetical protein
VPHRLQARCVVLNINIIGTPTVLLVLPHTLSSSHDLG